MTVLEHDVAHTICFVLFPVADKCETLYYIAEHGGLHVDGLNIN